MAIQIGNYNFDGPHTTTATIMSWSGVYVILGGSGDGLWNIVDIGESGNVRERLDNHDRADQWRRQGHRVLAAAVIYVHEADRMVIERELRVQHNPPCGDR